VDNLCAQRGLGYFPNYAVYATYHLRDHSPEVRLRWQELARALDELCAENGYRMAVNLGVGFDLWTSWCGALGMPLPVGLGDLTTLQRQSHVFACTGGDLWFHVKSSDECDTEAARRLIEERLGDITSAALVVPAHKRYGGKVLGGRFIDGLENPADHEDLDERVLIGGEDPAHRGAAFLITQKFVHDWTKLDALTEAQKQNMIGRDHENRLIPMDDDSSHIKRVRRIDEENVNRRVLRQALPYGHHLPDRSKEEGVFFAGYARSTEVFDKVIVGIVGDQPGFVHDQLFAVTRGEAGSYWYVPTLSECGLAPGAGNPDVTMNEYFDFRSANGLMFYNARDYQHAIRRSKLTEDCPLSERVLSLLNKQFSRWQDTWYHPRETPPLGHLRDYLSEDEKHLLTASVALRKGKANKISLGRVLTSRPYADKAGLMRIDPEELLVGNMPQLSLGIGTQVMEYLSDDERLTGFLGMLNEYSATGHNAPGYPLLIERGIGGITELFRQRLASADPGTADFYQSVVWSLEGLSQFIEAYAELAEQLAGSGQWGPPEQENLHAIAARMRRIAHEPPAGLVEALQLVFITNCAFHQLGEPHSIGRLDQQMIGLYRQDLASGAITEERAQEALDAFWLKMDETVLYNYSHVNDYLTYGSGAVFYSAGNFPQGAAINQWVQQVTVGGYLPNDDADPVDASNEITLMCLRSARRLPLNAPCLSLRVHEKTSRELLAEAAKAILSGGAHPILLNDDKLVPALNACGPLSLADARDYTCDGCYEPVIVGKTEWAFSYVPLLPMVDYAINEGCTVQAAGPINLKGLKSSWNSPPADEIGGFEQFLDIFFTHWKWAMTGFFNTLVNSYGSLAGYCPSPLFSALLSDTLETGRDLTDGGARYHLVAPMMCGITDTLNALYAIKKLVFDPRTARCSLPVLLRALQCDWGEDMKQPFYTTIEGGWRREADAELFRQLREAALGLPKFGVSTAPELTALADRVVSTCVQIIHDGLDSPLPAVAKGYEALKQKYGTPERPFAFTVTPGVGTFEDNVGLGLGFGASAGGRRSGQPIAADFTAAPCPSDLPLDPQASDPFQTLRDWDLKSVNFGIANGATIDLNIREDFPLDQLTELIGGFAHSQLGSNLITITCANPETYAEAMRLPERYDLVRVRMGGWSEFYVSMFDFHQEYIRRRPYYIPGTPA